MRKLLFIIFPALIHAAAFAQAGLSVNMDGRYIKIGTIKTGPGITLTQGVGDTLVLQVDTNAVYNLYSMDCELTGDRVIQGNGHSLSFYNGGSFVVVATNDPAATISFSSANDIILAADYKIVLSAEEITMPENNVQSILNGSYRIVVRDGDSGIIRTIAADTTVTTASTILSLTTRGNYVYTGSDPAAWSVPAAADYMGDRYFVFNRGTEDLTLTSAGNELYDTGGQANIVVHPDSGTWLYSDGEYWLIQ